MAKQQVRISIDRELYHEAEELGIDLAKACELGVRQMAAKLRTIDGLKDLEGME
ncbi:MAG: type II toxin-antitoxin system CcdA family antitoxin [Candidatus Bathyarchaeota archaeon]|nr:type II toxin-antitoxin system CcdA family antitoxin [Candidatus Bathyarchaeota archaeon]